jgi:hypothetical protein
MVLSKVLPVTFYLPRIEHLAELDELDADRDWHYFRRGTFSWNVQTFLRLRRAGYPVLAVNKAPESGVVFLHADDLHALLSSYHRTADVLTVCTRADRLPQHYADIEVVQNDRYADGRRVFFIPYWPQAGLVPRDPRRGSAISNIVFKGRTNELHRDFQTEAWNARLRDMGLTWTLDGAVWRDVDDKAAIKGFGWADYSDTDAIVAVRPNTSDPYCHKPASKLVNAWRAGVPALLGPEYAYRSLRRSELDYFEVTSADAAIEALRRLQASPGLFGDVVQNGLARAKDFEYDRIIEQWAHLLFEVVVPRYLQRGNRLYRSIPIGLRYRYRKLLAGEGIR